MSTMALMNFFNIFCFLCHINGKYEEETGSLDQRRDQDKGAPLLTTKTTVPLPKYINQRKLSKIQMLKEVKVIQIPIRTEGATPTHDRPGLQSPSKIHKPTESRVVSVSKMQIPPMIDDYSSPSTSTTKNDIQDYNCVLF